MGCACRKLNSVQPAPTIPKAPELPTLEAPAKIAFETPKVNVIRAAKNGDLQSIQQALDNGLDCNKRGMWKSTPLLFACQYAHVALAKCLALHPSIELDVVNERGASAFLMACLEGLHEIVQILLDRNAIIDTPPGLVYNSKTDTNTLLTPMEAASTNGHVSIIQLLLHANGSVTDKAILSACRYGHCDIVVLFANRVFRDTLKDEGGNTPILLASQYGHEKIAEYLFKNNVNIQCVNNQGKSILHYCAEHNFSNLTQQVLQCSQKLDINLQCFTSLETPVFIAAAHNHINVYTILVQHNADLTIQNDAGETPANLKRNLDVSVLQ